jgi:hypothetical protein
MRRRFWHPGGVKGRDLARSSGTLATTPRQLTQPSPFAVGHSLDRYVVVEELGRGGMGVVYLGTDTRLHRQVAIKVIALEGPTAVSRFMAEAQVTARCRHPNIVMVYSVGEENGHPYMVLELIEGESAQEMLERRPLHADRVVTLMTQVARGLAFAHSLGIIHRDLKPANILITTDGVPKIVDFGIAKPFDDRGLQFRLDGDSTGDTTSPGELVGTLHYISPEHVRGEPTDDRGDIWSFGVTLYQLLSGRRPFDGMSQADILEHLSDLDREVPRLDTQAPGLPPALVELTHRCLEKRVELRMASAAELVVALEALSPSSAPHDTIVVSQPARPAPRRRRARFVTALVLATFVAVIGGWLFARSNAGARLAPPADLYGEARVAALAADLRRLDQEGSEKDADRLLDEFLQEDWAPRTLALAWLVRGDRAHARRDGDRAEASYAAAYARASDDGTRRRALLALATVYLDRWEWDRLATVMDVYDSVPGRRDPREDELRERLWLARRDAIAASNGSSVARRVAKSMLQGRSLGVEVLSAVPIDLDGDGHDELVTTEGDDLVIRGGDALRELERHPHDGFVELYCAGRDDRGAFVVAKTRTTPRFRLVPLDGGRPVSLDRFELAVLGPCRWIDLDREGGDELYMLGYRSLVRLSRDKSGTWQTRITELGSVPQDLIGGDLDGDGRRELVVAVGEWRAYDVRLVRAGPDGTLQVHDRVRLGVVDGLVDLGRDGEQGARIAALKIDAWASIRSLPPSHPAGVPAGLYVLHLRGDRLTLDRFVELPGWWDAHVWAVLNADVDGDGRRDVVTRLFRLSDKKNHLMVMLGQPDGGFEARVVSGIDPIAVVQSDGDGADQILARIEDTGVSWILGGGQDLVPPRVIPSVPGFEPSAAARREPHIAATWQRAEQLARIGQVKVAAEALSRVAALAVSPAVRAELLRRATVLLDAAGLSTTPTLEALSELPSSTDLERIVSRLDAIDDDLRHAAFAEASHRVEELRRSGLSLTTGEANRLSRQVDQLIGPPQAVFSGDRLPSPWRVVDPSLVHVVPGSHQLTIETLAPGVVASLPLVGGERGITVTIDADVDRTEWSSTTFFRLAPRGRSAPGIDVGIEGAGGGRVYQRVYVCGPIAMTDRRSEPLPDADAPVHVHIEMAIAPGRGRCSITAGQVHVGYSFEIAASSDLRWELSIWAADVTQMSSMVMQVSSIEVAGAMPDPAPPSALDAVALALANHEAAKARTLLRATPRDDLTTWEGRRLTVIAADEVGDRRAATAALTAALTETSSRRASLRDVASLARARDGQFLPILRSAFGSRMALLLAEAWETAAYQNLDEPRVRAALLRDLDNLPRASAETRDATKSLLGYYGEALLESGRPDDARRVLLEAIALARPPGADALDRDERIAFLLAVEAAARGDERAARRWAFRSLELSRYPEYTADQLLLDPRTRAFTSSPGWERVRALGRDLALVTPD